MSQAVCVCGRPVASALLCRDCVRAWVADLDQVADLAADLAVVLSRQTRYGSNGGRRASERPVPFDVRVTDVAADVRATMRRVAEAAGMPGGGTESTTRACRWLAHNARRLATHADAPHMLEATSEILAQLRRVCDRPADLVYVGRCGGPRDRTQPLTPSSTCGCACHAGSVWRPACDVPGGCGHLHPAGDDASPLTGDCAEDLYARPGAPHTTCRSCHTTHDVAARQGALLASLEDQLASAADIARAVSRWGDDPVRADRIRQWHARGRLVQHGRDQRGDPTYRVGDILDLLTADAAARARTKQRAG